MLRAIRSPVGLGCLIVVCATSPLVAQSSGPATEPASEPTAFLPSYSYHLNLQRLVISDIRFHWQADLGGEVSLVDYGVGRLTFLANFETILGEQFRAVDPNQGTYTLDLSASIRFGRNELAGAFHHVSRHLSDRAKTFPIDWDMVGLQFSHLTNNGPLHLEAMGRVFFTTQRSFVDYRTELGGKLAGRYDTSERAAIIVRGMVTTYVVDRTVFQRDTQIGGRGEVGVRLTGGSGAVELFVAFERRIDADPLDLVAQRWTTFGFRLLSK